MGTSTYSRRGFLQLKPAPAAAPNAPRPASATVSGLEPYTGPWTAQEASHLLSRATFGGTRRTIGRAVDLGLAATVEELLADTPPPPPPVLTVSDGVVAAGETWVNAPYPEGVNLRRRVAALRRRSLQVQLQEARVREGISIRETMVLFWHNHFANSYADEPKWNYLHLNLLRREATGNFRQLVKEITVDSVMLAFLNGNQNTRRAPNENYARELLELFTVGKGPQVGPGDYTHYTEQDVVAMARSLTGWVTRGYRTSDAGQSYLPEFIPRRHDPATVQLSHRFDNRELTSTGPTTYARLVDLILDKRAAAEYIVRKLYRWLVYYEIPQSVETTIIQPLSDLFYASNYAIAPVLRTLLSSRHFYDVYSQGPMLKHPLRFVHGLIRQLEIAPPSEEQPKQEFYVALARHASQMGMEDFQAPSVAGWPAFYQEPLYYRQWVNSATLPFRTNLGQTLFNGRMQLSLLDVVNGFADPVDVWGMIDQWVTLLFPRPAPESQRVFLKELLLPGLPDTQWATEYVEYLGDPDNVQIQQALETNLRRMVSAMLDMPEYQLC